MLRRFLAALPALAVALAAWTPAPVHAAAPRDPHLRAHSPLRSAPPPVRAASGARPAAQPATVTQAGYIPCDLWSAYHMGAVDPTAGTGQTIAIVDPYATPTAQTDFAAFSNQFFGSPGSLRVVQPFGVDLTQPDASSWRTEITLDIEWAHAIAPGAQIVLVEARTSWDSDMLGAIDYAVTNVASDVVSMSWTFAESSLDASTVATWDSHFPSVNGAGRAVTYVAAAGDAGFQVNWPALSNKVIAVGGTSVAPQAFGYSAYPGAHDTCAPTLTPGVTSATETVWGTASGGSGTGGGTSAYEASGSYQSGPPVNGNMRETPDVAMLADPNTGVALYESGAWSNRTYGGTSLGTPIWAAITARINALKGNNLSGVEWLYTANRSPSPYNDITSGSAAPTGGSACVAATTCTAKAGYDEVTGLGSPLLTQLATNVPTPPPPASYSFTSYFPWFDRVSDPGFKNDNIHVVNPNGAPVGIQVSIPGCALQNDTLSAGSENYYTCNGGIGGPVVIRSTERVVATQRVQYYQTFNEVQSLSSVGAAPDLVFSWFDRVSDPGFTADNIHVVNPGATKTTVSVDIPGCATQSQAVDPGGYGVFTCANGFGGPVHVHAGQPVLATQRVKYYGSFNEVAAMPAAGLAPSLWLSWFDKVSDPGFTNDNVHVVGPVGTWVHAAIPGCATQNAQLPASGETYFSCATIGGPVHITADDGASNPVDIVASQRVQYFQSFNEVAASQLSAAGGKVWIAWYDMATDPGFTADNIHVVNPGATSGSYSVSIPGCPDQRGQLAAGGETYVSCAGHVGGPVVVQALTTGVPLLASARVKYYTSFNEVSGSA